MNGDHKFLHVFSGKNFPAWLARIQILLCAKNILEVLKDPDPGLPEKELKKSILVYLVLNHFCT